MLQKLLKDSVIQQCRLRSEVDEEETQDGLLVSQRAAGGSSVLKVNESMGVVQWTLVRPTKKNCYVALTRPKFENWVGRSIFFFFRTVREFSFPIIFFKSLNGENSGGMQSKRIYKCFLSHWIQILANSSPKSDIFDKKKQNKKNPTLFFRILRSVGRGQHNNNKKFGLITSTDIANFHYNKAILVVRNFRFSLYCVVLVPLT